MRLPVSPPNWLDQFREAEKAPSFIRDISRPDVQEFVRQANEVCLHWDKLRFRPLPEGLTSERAWAAIQLTRQSQIAELPIQSMSKPFKFWVPSQQQEWLSKIDKQAAGAIASASPYGIADDDERYIQNSLMEEAIASSVIEGAVTMREVAKEMLRSKRQPKTKSEQMILNNYKAILEIRELNQEPLSPSLLCHLQEVLTEKALDNEDAAGRFRLASENVNVVDSRTSEIVFTPPPAETIDARIKELCAFANSKSKTFVHPVIKAIALHFAVGFIHPFVDGNGRTARAIFYWHMLKSGYWLFEYLPISRIILAAPTKYSRAYLLTETDDGDLTYFNQFHLKVIVRAIDEFHEYLREQRRQRENAELLVEEFPSLNLRQRLILQNALRRPKNHYTITEHAGEYRVTYNTARADLCGLEEAGLLVKRKIKKEWVFQPVPDLIKKLSGGL